MDFSYFQASKFVLRQGATQGYHFPQPETLKTSSRRSAAVEVAETWFGELRVFG